MAEVAGEHGVSGGQAERRQERLDDATVERARNAQSLASLVARRVKLRRSGRGWVGLCPFHQEKSPSFGVVEGGRSGDFYHCFGCGAHGDSIEWLVEAEGLSFRDAVAALLNDPSILSNRDGSSVSLPDGRTRFAPVERESAQRPVEFVSSAHAGRWIFRTSGPARGEIVEKYLAWRGCDPAAEFLPGFPAIDEIRFHPRCPVGAWRVDREPESHWLTYPAMVVPIRDLDDAIWGVEVTWLRSDGNGHAEMPRLPDGKARPKRKIFGRVGGLAAWLTPSEAACSSAALVVGEGFETSWSFAQDFGRPCRVAATLNLRNMMGFERKIGGGSIPLWNPQLDREAAQPFTMPDAGEVVIAVDADMKPIRDQKVQLARGSKPVRRDVSGLERAEICASLAAQAWRLAGARSVKCVRPRMGADFNDQIRGRAAA